MIRSEKECLEKQLKLSMKFEWISQIFDNKLLKNQ